MADCCLSIAQCMIRRLYWGHCRKPWTKLALTHRTWWYYICFNVRYQRGALIKENWQFLIFALVIARKTKGVDGLVAPRRHFVLLLVVCVRPSEKTQKPVWHLMFYANLIAVKRYVTSPMYFYDQKNNRFQVLRSLLLPLFLYSADVGVLFPKRACRIVSVLMLKLEVWGVLFQLASEDFVNHLGTEFLYMG